MNKTIHRIWIGPEPMPANYKDYGQQWQDMNPDWVVKDWGNEEVFDTAWINKAVVEHIMTPLPGMKLHPVAAATQVADVISYEILYNYGGLYLNTDIQPVRPLQHLFDMAPVMEKISMATREDDHYIVNAAMWAPEPRIPFWYKVITNLPLRYFSDINGYMNGTTGPHLLTTTYYENQSELIVLGKDVFNPVHFRDVPLGGEASWNKETLPAVTVGVHHWGHRKNQRPQTASV